MASSVIPMPHHVSTKEIWSLTWPQAVMMLCQFLIGLTDVMVAGHISTEVQAAFGIISQCLFLLLVVGNAVASGGVAAMSQALGARLVYRAEHYVGLIIKLAGLLCIITLFAGYFFRFSIFSFLAVPQNIQPLTGHLWVIFLCTVPGSYFIIFSGAVFRSRKRVRIPLFAGVAMCTVNAILAIGLGLGHFGMPRLGGEGMALASIIAIYTGAGVNFIALRKLRYLSKNSFAPWRWEKKAFPYIFKVALPSGGLQVVWQLGYLLLFSIVGTLPAGVAGLAGLTAGNRVEGMLFLPMVAFGMTGSILVGHCLGAGDKAEAKRVALKVMGASIVCMTLIAAVVYQFIPDITMQITTDSAVKRVASDYLRYNFLAVPFTCVSMVVGGIMAGAGATLYTFIVYGSATWLIRLPLAWYLGHTLGYDTPGVFFAMLISQIFQAAIILFILFRCDWYRFASTAKRFRKGSL